MKNRIFVTIATLLVITGLLLSVAAKNSGGGNSPQLQPKNPPVPLHKAGQVMSQPKAQFKVRIECRRGDGEVSAKVNAINNTSQTIKKGKVIYYSTSKGNNGSFTLDADLPAGGQRKIGLEICPYTCQAWFFKK